MILLNQYLIDTIFDYNSPYHNSYQKCLYELAIIIKKYNMISVTYNIIRDDQTRFFKNYNPIFSKFYLIQTNS